MALLVYIRNTSGLAEISSYDVEVLVNEQVIASGHVEGHPRANGWRALLRKIANAETVVDHAQSRPAAPSRS